MKYVMTYLPLAVEQKHVQLTAVGRQDFWIHQRFKRVHDLRVHLIQPGLQSVHLYQHTKHRSECLLQGHSGKTQT